MPQSEVARELLEKQLSSKEEELYTLKEQLHMFAAKAEAFRIAAEQAGCNVAALASKLPASYAPIRTSAPPKGPQPLPLPPKVASRAANPSSNPAMPEEGFESSSSGEESRQQSSDGEASSTGTEASHGMSLLWTVDRVRAGGAGPLNGSCKENFAAAAAGAELSSQSSMAPEGLACSPQNEPEGVPLGCETPREGRVIRLAQQFELEAAFVRSDSGVVGLGSPKGTPKAGASSIFRSGSSFTAQAAASGSWLTAAEGRGGEGAPRGQGRRTSEGGVAAAATAAAVAAAMADLPSKIPGFGGSSALAQSPAATQGGAAPPSAGTVGSTGRSSTAGGLAAVARSLMKLGSGSWRKSAPSASTAAAASTAAVGIAALVKGGEVPVVVTEPELPSISNTATSAADISASESLCLGASATVAAAGTETGAATTLSIYPSQVGPPDEPASCSHTGALTYQVEDQHGEQHQQQHHHHLQRADVPDGTSSNVVTGPPTQGQYVLEEEESEDEHALNFLPPPRVMPPALLASSIISLSFSPKEQQQMQSFSNQSSPAATPRAMSVASSVSSRREDAAILKKPSAAASGHRVAAGASPRTGKPPTSGVPRTPAAAAAAGAAQETGGKLADTRKTKPSGKGGPGTPSAAPPGASGRILSSRQASSAAGGAAGASSSTTASRPVGGSGASSSSTSGPINHGLRNNAGTGIVGRTGAGDGHGGLGGRSGAIPSASASPRDRTQGRGTGAVGRVAGTPRAGASPGAAGGSASVAPGSRGAAGMISRILSSTRGKGTDGGAETNQ